ncbi:hypothetical protein BIW11_08004 [Tropilaelaps mercedesae]|uniref:BRCA2 OB1 domain-containing protein n=1 Tax=Tropilaelaps mercedesae TaxID=418985 RepID=A0A1V9XRF3_9ACAR|nr:hypothetical protein BIW11_08004 [Tropilaelaps mercedesae]
MFGGISVERDESSERTVVLLVKQIKPELVLSDGWYSIPCDVDSPLAVVLSRVGSKLSINPGHKLCISGAILRGPRNGVDPLHLEGARLSINYNSTRRARWYAPLGFCRKTLTVPLFSVLLHGGTLPLIRVQVTSCSSLMYFEKFAQGGSVIRKESDEIKEQRRFHEEMVEIQERVRKEVLSKIEEEGWTAKRKLRPRGKNKPSNFTSGEEIYEAVEASHDPSQILAGLTASQKEMLERHRENVQSALRARVEEAVRRRMTELREKEECPHERKVAPLLKLLVRCTSSRVEVPLTIWRPSEELRTLLSRPHVIVAILRAKATSSRNFPFGLTTTQSNIHCLSSDGSPGKEDTEQKKQRRTLEDVAVPSKRLRF